MIGIGCKADEWEKLSSYLVEHKGLCWDSIETKRLVHGRKLIVWIDSESTYVRTTKREVSSKILLDVWVSRQLSWIWSNFRENQMQIGMFLESLTRNRIWFPHWERRWRKGTKK